ncbi:MAG: Capsular polysaccharide synthesis enzyme CpsA, sugar transferase [Myxococcaceae bacterium]|nr:Capsular polysaccharide synthesis enzyme CpsA, sugar transferase [Myxococcaceae bacterium]
MVNKGSVLQQERNLSAWFARFSDSGLIFAAHYVATFFRDWRTLLDPQLALGTLLAIAVFLIIGDANGLYRPTLRSAPAKVELGKVWLSWGFTPPILLTIAFLTKTGDYYSRLITLIWFLLAPTLISTVRFVSRRVEGEMYRRGVATRGVHIVGATKMGGMIAQRIMDDPSSGMRVDGYFDDRDPERLNPMPERLGPPIGRLSDLLALAQRGKVDIVYIALPLRAESRISDIVRKLADSTASVYVVADFLVFDLVHAQWSNVQGLPVVSVFESPFYGVNGWLKRVEDLVLGSIILLLIAFPMAFIALGVKLSSQGPVFFRQRRYGLNGEEIRVLKFRTMTVTEDGAAVMQAKKNDQRVTRFGSFLRRTSLDELPQFINVLMGEMSIVGPRPHAVSHNEMYRRMIHGYMLRHKVKPGITGWAQVNGWRGETDTVEKMEQRVNHDLHYIQNWGLLFDLKIIFKTIFGSGTRQNAY